MVINIFLIFVMEDACVNSRLFEYIIVNYVYILMKLKKYIYYVSNACL